MTKREPLMNEEYFDHHILVVDQFIQETVADMATYANQAAARFNVLQECLTLLYARYSRGYPIATLQSDLVHVLEAWEALPAVDVDDVYTPNSFKNDMTNYVTSLGLLSLAMLLHCDASVVSRLVVCIGNEGQDLLYERFVAKVLGPQKRKPAKKLLYPKAYQALYDALDAPSEEQPRLVQQFVQHWYKHLGRVGWYNAHKGPEGGGFMGYWCWEAAGVAYAFGIYDATFRDLRYYPKDLAEFARTENPAA
jgi:alkylation response protein AidB-like acyl-CoA dehydrogenase